MSGQLVHVPTAPELALQGLAREVVAAVRAADGSTKADRRWRLTPEGQRLVYEAQAHNAALLRDDPELRRVAEQAAFRRNR